MLRTPGFKLNKKKTEKRLGVKVRSWNVGSISARAREVCEELRKRKMGVCCSQEVRWRGKEHAF